MYIHVHVYVHVTCVPIDIVHVGCIAEYLYQHIMFTVSLVQVHVFKICNASISTAMFCVHAHRYCTCTCIYMYMYVHGHMQATIPERPGEPGASVLQQSGVDSGE